jgi:uncharacterized protein with ParB-like and HNH nuclease domain
MKKIVGKEKSVNDLLARKKYSIHYYQREYRWGRKQVEELISDLTDEFNESYEENHLRREGANYGHYYLGSVVITSDESDRAIIDGQQRLTSLTLLLIYLNNLQINRFEEEQVHISDLIYSEEYGIKSFNISVDERADCLNAIFKDEEYDPTNKPESVQTIYSRYQDIKDIFPDDLKGKALPFFIEWIIKKVHLVEITAYTEQDAHKVFVSMNDRGLSLTPTEMLKGYLLSEIKNDEERNKANDLWKDKILAIKNLNENSKEDDADFIKNWLRAQYAETIRDTKKDAEKEDFDLIGTEFHKWVRENAISIGLNHTSNYEEFILKEFNLFADTYLRLKKYSQKLYPDFEYVFYNSHRNFTLQYQLILAALDRNDNSDIVDRKIKAVSYFIDEFSIRRIINFKRLGYNDIKNWAFGISKTIRRASPETLNQLLLDELNSMEFTFDSLDRFYMNQYSSRFILHMLSRLTHYIESGSGMPSSFENYVDRFSKIPYDIEHIWADKYNRYRNECSDEDDFERSRNRFGALLLLPRDKNRSFQDKPYQDKLPIYFSENLLARSLNENCYKNNPQFLKFITSEELAFQPHSDFRKSDIELRQKLYKAIALKIWDSKKISEFLFNGKYKSTLTN